MRAHLIQSDIAWENKAESRDRAQRLIASAAPEAGDLVVLPEMCETGFSMNIRATADDDGSSRAWLARLAADYSCYVLGGVTVSAPAGKALNRAVLASPSAVIAEYDKAHPFSFGAEAAHFIGGTRVVVAPLPLPASATDAQAPRTPLMLAPIICYDLRFPELFRAARALGAEVFAVIANWPAERAHHWRAMLIARAIENQAVVLGVNRAGADPTLRYCGGSIAVGPRGEVLAEAGAEPSAISLPLDPHPVREWRSRFRAWEDAKPGLLPRVADDGSWA